MTDHKFTDEEIVKALEHCASDTSGEACKGCPFDEFGACTVEENALAIEALSLINRQKEEIQKLVIDRNAARLGMIAEHERLKMARAEVAREIFAEIEELAKIYTLPVIQKGIVEIEKEPFWCIEPSDLAELKKKYTDQP